MARNRSFPPYLEIRRNGYYWRRRLPVSLRQAMPICLDDDSDKIRTPSRKMLLCFSLRTNLPFNAKTLARRLTEMSDLVYAANAEMIMAIAPETQVQLLESLVRFEIEAFELARSVASPRSPEVAAVDLQREEALQTTLRQALYLGDREVARDPLRHVAEQLGVSMDESTQDWSRLAYEATKVLLDISKERQRRQQGLYQQPTPAFQRALSPNMMASTTQPGLGLAKFDGEPAGFAASALCQPEVSSATEALTQGPAPTEPTTTEHAAPRPTDTDAAPTPLEKTPEVQETGSDSSIVPADLEMPAGYTEIEWQRARVLARPPRLFVDKKLLSTDSQAALAKQRGITISQAVHLYFDVISLGYKAPFDCARKRKPISPDLFSKPIEERLNEDHKGKFRFASDFWPGVFGDAPVDEISFDEVNDALALMWRVPNNRGRSASERERYSTIELIERADARASRGEKKINAARSRNASSEDIDKLIKELHVPRVRVDTYVKHGRVLRAIGEMLYEMQLIDHNPFSICTWSKNEVSELKRHEGAHARQAWDDRFYTFLSTPIFTRPLEDVGEPLFWAPLIARLMGLRMEECLQLGPQDFGTNKRIPYLRIEQNIVNGTKTLSSERTLPVHPQLIELGLLKFVQLRKKQGHMRLFPHLTRSAQKATFSANFSKRFGYYRRNNDCYWPGLDFHALRTTFHTDLLTDDKSDAVRCRLMGHVPGDEGTRSYAQSLGIETLLKRLDSVEIDISNVVRPFELNEAQVKARAAERGLRVVS